MRVTGRCSQALRSEVTTYLLVALVLVVTGALLRTVLLNWIVGPVFVVVGVTVLSAARERRRAAR
jgi:hypothetical protein